MSELKKAVQDILNEKPILMESYDSTFLHDFHHILRENFGITDVNHKKIANIVKLANASNVETTEALRDVLKEQLDESDFSTREMSDDLKKRLRYNQIKNFDGTKDTTYHESIKKVQEFQIGISHMQGGVRDITSADFERNWGGRTPEMREKLNSTLHFEKGVNPNIKMLTIGPRWPAEITYIREKFSIDAMGLDLFSIDKSKIMEGDMHDMPIEDNTYDIVYEKNTFNKSYNFRKALDESVRVLKNGGLLIYDECMDYVAGCSENARTNLKSHKWTEIYLGDSIEEVIYSKQEKAPENQQHWLGQVGLFIARIKK